ncbi:MAG: RNA polymerase factor sigma-54, partial [Myxococcota bacterium]
EEAGDEDETSPNGLDTSAEQAPGQEELDGVAPEVQEFDLSAMDVPSEAPTAEDVVGDVDWENYMESSPQTGLGRVDEERPRLEDNLTPTRSLADHLMWQLGFLELSENERFAAALIIGNLNDDGYLEEDLEKIAADADLDLAAVEALLQRLQLFDPLGVGSRSLSECLLVQARVAGIEDPLVLTVLRDHLDRLQKKDFRGIARIEDVSVQDVARAARVVAQFEPRPGREFSGEDPIYITPDIFIHKIAGDFHVVLNEDGLPKLRVSSAYREVLTRRGSESKEAREYVREKLRSAVWLIKSIHQRQRTIVRVTDSILRFQSEFFERGTEFLRPLNLRDVAEDIGMHESTVSRVTSNKYVQTPHGLFELKFFFNSSIETADGRSIASESVKEKIRDIIRSEDARRPLSDQQIAEVLRMSAIHIARRTVTKYREALRILPSTRRREIG